MTNIDKMSPEELREDVDPFGPFPNAGLQIPAPSLLRKI